MYNASCLNDPAMEVSSGHVPREFPASHLGEVRFCPTMLCVLMNALVRFPNAKPVILEQCPRQRFVRRLISKVLM